MDIFDRVLEEHQKSLEEFKRKKEQIFKIYEILNKALSGGNKILICGNGGSAADASHMAAELVGRFVKERKGLCAVSLSTDTSILTSVSNDYSFELVFARQVEAIGKEGDVLVGFSTSGKSKNVIKAFEKAKSMGIITVGILGNPGFIEKISDVSFTINGTTARVQEIHSILIHILCEMIEE